VSDSMSEETRQDAKPVLAILGRPNVGKSTLFNRLTKTRDALVADVAGVTRDVNVGVGRIGRAAYFVADTGGIDSFAKDNIHAKVTDQALGLVADSDVLLLLVDAKDGLSSEDQAIAVALRKTGKPVYLVINKLDHRDVEIVTAEFSGLGLGAPLAISAISGAGVDDLVALVTADWHPNSYYSSDIQQDRIRVAVVGRPNVGKSTLVNRMLGEERMITADFPGTTRDSVATDFERRSVPYTLIDTAGIRRRGRVSDVVEKFSAIKALQAIDLATVVIVVMDAQEAITDQDVHLLGLVVESGRSAVIAVNKWDGLENDDRDRIRRELDRKLKFIDYAETMFISALHGTGVGNLYGNIQAAWRSSQVTAQTSTVTEMLLRALETHQPPMVRGRRVKLRYAHFGGRNPPTIIIHGNQTASVPESYRRYLANYFRNSFKLIGTQVRIEFKQGKNPYSHKRNVLTPKQAQRRRRLMKHVKS
jgi:GTP-binding protein